MRRDLLPRIPTTCGRHVLVWKETTGKDHLLELRGPKGASMGLVHLDDGKLLDLARALLPEGYAIVPAEDLR